MRNIKLRFSLYNMDIYRVFKCAQHTRSDSILVFNKKKYSEVATHRQ